MEISRLLSTGEVVQAKDADAGAHRERQRQRRLVKLAVLFGIPVVWFWVREFTGTPVRLGMPSMLRDNPELTLLIVLMSVMMLLMIVPFLSSGRSPHTVLRPEDSTVRLADVVGATATKREAIDTLNIFLNHEKFLDQMGGSARRGVLFEGPPGTGKTYLAKALAAEAGVPFLFVSASEFQSMFYGQTNRKVRTFFKALRKAARAEGDEAAAAQAFESLAAQPEARFLGLRGLLRQAEARGDWDAAREIAAEAQGVEPAAAWLRAERSEVARRRQDWSEALAHLAS